MSRDFTGKAVKSACYAPFVSLYLTPTGGVQACCRNETFMLGNLNEQRLRDIWQGGRIKALRKSLADYKFNLGCAFCEWESNRRGDSFAIRLMTDHFPVPAEEPEWPALIEFNGSNTCNLECIMCHGEYSSSIRGNRDGLPPMPKVYDDQFFQDLRPFLPHLQFLNLLGGEPFLAAEIHRVWEMMREDGLTIPCRVTTNGTLYNAKIEGYLEATPIHITVSLDGVTKQTYESIRHRSTFETVIANLHRFRAYTRQRGTNFGISFCLMRQNWHELGEMALFAEKLDCELSILMPVGPSHCTLFTLPRHELQSVVSQIEALGSAILPQLRRHRKAWQETVAHLREAAEADQMRKLETVMSYYLPDNPLSVAEKLAEEGKYDRALRRLRSISPGHPDFYYALALSGAIKGLQGDDESALADLEHALSISRKLPDAYLNLARIEFQRENLDAALDHALRAEERVTPESRAEARLLILIAFLHVARSNLRSAWAALTRLAKLPEMSCEGLSLPDSLDAARRSAGTAADAPIRPRIDRLASRVRRLYRLASGQQRQVARFRATGVGRLIFDTQAPGRKAGKISTPGAAIQPLLPDDAPALAHWTLRVAGVNNEARLVVQGENAIRIAITRAHTGVSHDIQLNYARLAIVEGQRYRVRFRIRADAPRSINVGIAKAGPPWSNSGLHRVFQIDASWLVMEFCFTPSTSDDNVRLHFDAGESAVPIEVAALVWTVEDPSPQRRPLPPRDDRLLTTLDALWKERFAPLPLHCDRHENPGIDEVEEWRDWTRQETTPDQLRIEDCLAAMDVRGRRLLHVGLGNSGLAQRFHSELASIVGLTICPGEAARARQLELNNYTALVQNKYSLYPDSAPEAFAARFDFIVDNNPSTFGCCGRHFMNMLLNYRDLLRAGGLILTDRVGLGWVVSAPESNPRWSFDFADWCALGTAIGLEGRQLTEYVYSLSIPDTGSVLDS